MKRVGGLFDRIWDRDVLVAAVWRAARGKRDRPEVRSLLARAETEWRSMATELRTGAFRFGPYRTFQIRDTKTRMIHAPTFRDRVAHHAIIGVTGPIFERGALPTSFACRAGRGQHAALDVASRWTHRGGWYGKIDVEKFYDSVDHATLLSLLRRRFRERRLLGLFETLIASYETAPGKGIPIGALTSQYLGNFMLDEFDRRILATGCAARMVRYMDDVVFWGNRTSLGTVRSAARTILADLGLAMKHDGEWNRCERGVPFLGFVLYPGRVRLNAKGRCRLRRRLVALEGAWKAGNVSDSELQTRVASMFAHAAHGDDLAWRRDLVARSRYAVGDGVQHGPETDGTFSRGRESRDSRRLVDQLGEELPVVQPQQELARQPQQEPGLQEGLSSLSRPRHDGAPPTDDAASRSSATCVWNEFPGLAPGER